MQNSLKDKYLKILRPVAGALASAIPGGGPISAAAHTVQQVRQSPQAQKLIGQNIGRLRNVDPASTYSAGVLQARLSDRPLVAAAKNTVRPLPGIGPLVDIPAGAKNMLSRKPMFASEVIQKRVPGKAGALLGLGAELSLPNILPGGEVKSGASLLKTVAKKGSFAALPAAISAAAESKNLAEVPRRAAVGGLFGAGLASASPVARKLPQVLGDLDLRRSLKGVNPKVFSLDPTDVDYLAPIAEKLRAKKPLDAREFKSVHQFLTTYYPGVDPFNVKDKKIVKLMEYAFDKSLHIPKGEASSFPGLGNNLVGKADRVPQVFKTEKFNVDDAGQAALKTRLKDQKLDTRSVRSFDEMKAKAEELGLEPGKLIKDVQSGRITDAEVIALGNTVSTSSQRIADLTRKLAQDPTNGKLRSALDAEEELINQAIRKRVKGGTEAGRAVAAFKVIANKNLEPAYWLDKAARQIGTDKDLPPDVVTAINGYITNKDRLGLATFVAKLGESSGLEKAIGLWKASLLTGFRTHEANIVSNTAFGALETFKDLPAASFDTVRSALTGRPRTVSFGLENITGQGAGAREGFQRARGVLRGDLDPNDIRKAENIRELRFGTTPLGRLAQKATGAVFKTLGAEDKVFYGAAFRRSLEEQARTARINKTISPDGVRQLVENPTEEMLATAAKDAAYATFTNENDVNNALRAFKRAGGPKLAAAVDFVMPFTRTPTNVAKATFVDYTPIGFATEAIDTIQNIIRKQPVDERALAQAFGRSATGTGILALGVELAKRNLITGPSPSSEAERAQWELEGKTPNSVFINGKWRSASRISPLGNLLVLGAQAHNSGYNLAETGLAGLKAFSENSFLKGAGSALKAINEPERSAGSFVNSTAAGYIPTLAADVASGIDPYKRKPEGLKETVMARLPGLRELVPEKLNSLGEPVKAQGGLVGRLTDPFNSSKPSDDALVGEMKRVGSNLNYVGDSISQQALTREQERAYQKAAGRYVRELLPQLIADPGYQSLDVDAQRDLIERTVDKAKDAARDELRPQLGDFSSDAGQADAAAPTSRNSMTLKLQVDQARDQVRTSGKPVAVAGKVYYQAGSEVHSVPLERAVSVPKLSGNKELDSALMSKYQGEITSRITEVRKLYELDQLSADQAGTEIAQLNAQRDALAAIKKQGKKAAKKTGGTVRMKQVKRPKISVARSGKSSIKKIKLQRLGTGSRKLTSRRLKKVSLAKVPR